MFKFIKNILRVAVAGGTVTGIILLKDYNQGGKFTDPVRVDGKVAIVTGANTGIGKETARELARRGATVYMACRCMKRCEKSKYQIMLNTKNHNVHCIQCDLSSFKSIMEFVQKFKEQESELHILVNNAGIMGISPLAHTEDGIEMHLGVNHMGHFLLTNLLLDYLMKSAPSRVVVVSSMVHHAGKINVDDLNSDITYDAAEAYTQSKLANILFANELAKRLAGTGVTVNSLHPGLCSTELTRNQAAVQGDLSPFINALWWPFVKNPVSGAQTSLFVALDPSLNRVTGRYFTDCAENSVAKQAKDEEMQAWLWDASALWTGLAAQEPEQDAAPAQ